MRKVILILYFFISNLFFSQDKLDALVEYKYVMTLDANKNNNIVQNKYLLMNNEKSYFFFYKDKNSYEDVFNNYSYNYFAGVQEYIISENKIIDFRRLVRNVYYSEELLPKIDWKILEGQKEILGYKCKRALGYFRGRNYFVWFTNDIPYSYGPWKLNGLSGLILEAEDSEHIFQYSATRIVLNKGYALPSVLVEKMKQEKSNTISYKDYIKIENNFLLDLRNKQKSNLPKGVILMEDSPIRSLMPEKSFEWEETNKP